MNVKTIISEEFRFYTMNYALAQRKEVSDLDINAVYKQWEYYQEKKIEHSQEKGKVIDIKDYEKNKKAKEITDYVLKNTKSW